MFALLPAPPALHTHPTALVVQWSCSLKPFYCFNCCAVQAPSFVAAALRLAGAQLFMTALCASRATTITITITSQRVIVVLVVLVVLVVVVVAVVVLVRQDNRTTAKN